MTVPARTTTEETERSGFAMKFVLACYGARGDVEPSVAVGRELLRRGHDVRIALPPNLVGFAGGSASGGRVVTGWTGG